VKGYQQICDTSSNHGAHQMRESATSGENYLYIYIYNKTLTKYTSFLDYYLH